MKEKMFKYTGFLVMMLCLGVFVGCSNGKESVVETKNAIVEEQTEEIENVTGSVNQEIETEADNVNSEIKNETDRINQEIVMENVDYSKNFNGLNGCAVIYNPLKNQYLAYNQEMCKVQVSPYSTFKIISTLMGLNYGVLAGETSLMKYNGTKYPIDLWNKNMPLKEAFQTSCIWYFRQVIDSIGQEKVAAELKELQYGNGDISEWEGSNVNPLQDLNGFWLSSSLKISPLEQVQMLAKIFEEKSHYTKEQVDVLKSMMAIDDSENCEIYGKTGSGTNGEAWYIGFSEKNETKTYFAIYLEDSKHKDVVSGNAAKKIAIEIMK